MTRGRAIDEFYSEITDGRAARCRLKNKEVALKRGGGGVFGVVFVGGGKRASGNSGRKKGGMRHGKERNPPTEDKQGVKVGGGGGGGLGWWGVGCVLGGFGGFGWGVTVPIRANASSNPFSPQIWSARVDANRFTR